MTRATWHAAVVVMAIMLGVGPAQARTDGTTLTVEPMPAGNGLLLRDPPIEPFRMSDSVAPVLPALAETRTDIGPGSISSPTGRSSDQYAGDDVSFRIAWSPATDDVDLHVIDPLGNHIWYQNTSCANGGRLDRDDRTSGGAESVSWSACKSPAGTYRFYAVYFHGSGPKYVTLDVCAGGRIVRRETFVLGREKDQSSIFTFTAEPGNLADTLERYHQAGWDNVLRHGDTIINTAGAVGFAAGSTTANIGAMAGSIVEPGIGTAAGYVVGHKAPEAVTGLSLTAAAYGSGVAVEALTDMGVQVHSVTRSVRVLPAGDGGR